MSIIIHTIVKRQRDPTKQHGAGGKILNVHLCGPLYDVVIHAVKASMKRPYPYILGCPYIVSNGRIIVSNVLPWELMTEMLLTILRP